MSSFRRASALLLGIAVATSVLSAPAQSDPSPTTLALEGTVQVAVVDTFVDADHGEGHDEHGHGDYLHAVVTADGTRVPVELDDEVPAGAEFVGEVVVEDTVESVLDDRGLLPRVGSTIAEDSRAGRAAISAAEKQTEPLTVASSSVTAPRPVTTTAVSSPIRAYVAIINNRGPGTVTSTQATSLVTAMGGYWKAESDNVLNGATIVGVKSYAAGSEVPTSDTTCGMAAPFPMWEKAAAQFPGVNFSSSRNHLIVLNTCRTDTGPAGVGTIGRNVDSGGLTAVSVGDGQVLVGAHELGHNFGLDHANRLRCVTANECYAGEYLNFYSVMGLALGAFAPPALDSAYRRRLGLDRPGEVRSVVAPTRNLQLQPRGSSAGARALQVIDPGSGVTYLVEWRSGTGRDAGASYRALPFDTSVPPYVIRYRPGITVTTLNSDSTTWLFSTRVGNEIVTSLANGQTFVAPGGRVRIKATSSAGRVDVTVPLRRFSAPRPKIRGTVRVGKTLKVKVGAWNLRASYSYQWYANGKKIAKKGTRSSFKLTSRQKGKRITVRVTGRKAGYAPLTKTSARTAKVKKR